MQFRQDGWSYTRRHDEATIRIYPGVVTLIDGSVMRMPFIKIFVSDGTPMEMHPHPVDMLVKRAVGESYTARDMQLDTPIAELLKQLGSGAKRSSP